MIFYFERGYGVPQHRPQLGGKLVGKAFIRRYGYSVDIYTIKLDSMSELKSMMSKATTSFYECVEVSIDFESEVITLNSGEKVSVDGHLNIH